MRIRNLIGVSLGLAFSAVSQANVVYDNLPTPPGFYLGGFSYEEVADEVSLGPGPRIFATAEIGYAGFDFVGDETLTLTLYTMDGAPTPGSFGFNTPGTVLFTQTIPIAATSGAVVSFSDVSGTVVLPDIVGIGLMFGGVDFDPTGSDAGPLVNDPPTVGSSLDDFWLRGVPNPGDDWALYTYGGNPAINLVARLTTVPEPTTLALFGLGLAGVPFVRRRKTA